MNKTGDNFTLTRVRRTTRELLVKLARKDKRSVPAFIEKLTEEAAKKGN